MYSSPFGSLFGEENKLKPKAKAAQEKVVAKAKAKTPPAQPKKGKVVDHRIKISTEETAEDPLLLVENALLAYNELKQKNNSIKRKIEELRRKYGAAQVYKDSLSLFRKLEPSDKANLEKWLLKHLTAIKHLSSARKLAKITANTQEAVKTLDNKIKHKENILKLRKAGAETRTQLMNVTPGAEVYEQPLPRLYSKGKAVNAKLSYATLAGDQATDIATKAMARSEALKKEATKGKAKENVLTRFKKKLDGPYDEFDKREKAKIPRRLTKKAEHIWAERKKLEWAAQDLEKEFVELSKKYAKLQEELEALIGVIGKSPAVNTLATLIEARPNKFLSSGTLLTASQNAFKHLSQLGDETPDTPPTPEEEAKKLLEEQAAKSEATLKELETRQNALAQVEAELEGKPAPAPIQIFVIPPPPPEPKKTVVVAKQANRILPWIAGLMLFFKLLES
jgi:hypothetical protein